MNRKEAIKVFEEIKVNYDSDPDWGVYDGVFSRRNLTEILDAYTTLLSPQTDPSTGYSHTHKPYNQPGISLLLEAICPKCGKPMCKTGSLPAGVIQCDLHHWKCDDCGIQREQAHDWPIFQPREWHRPRYSINGGEWIGEGETEKLKAALDALTEVEG